MCVEWYICKIDKKQVKKERTKQKLFKFSYTILSILSVFTWIMLSGDFPVSELHNYVMT